MAIGLSKTQLESQIRRELSSGFSPKEVQGAVAGAIAKAVADAIDKNNRVIQQRLEAAGVKL